MSVNIQDVAKAAKVSVSTVSRSFTRPELVSEATRSRVLRIADEMSFSISRSATALKSGKALRVALLMSDLYPTMVQRFRHRRVEPGFAR